MEIAFFLSSAVAVIATVLAISNVNPVHALLLLIVSLLSVAMIFFTLGAPFAGILEIIVYAGAILVLFVFVVMMLNLGPSAVEQERHWLKPTSWVAPSVLSLILLGELLGLLPSHGTGALMSSKSIDGEMVGAALYGPYLLAVELGSMLLLAGLVAAFHLGRKIADEPGDRE